MKLYKRDYDYTDNTRNQLNVYWDDRLYSEMYSRYYMKLQDNLESLMPANESTWRDIMEWRESGTDGNEDFRVTLFVKRNKYSHPYGSDTFFFDSNAEQIRPTKTTIWQQRNGDIEVPVGRWFLLEVLHKRDVTNGLLKVWVDGQPVIDVEGVQTKLNSSLSKWNLFKVYTGEDSMTQGTA